MPYRIHPNNAAIEVMRALEDASEASEGRKRFTFDAGDWNFSGCARYSYPRPWMGLDVDYVSDLSHDCHRLEYIARLCDALKKSALDLLEIHERALAPIASKLSKGITILPDELLGLIFKFATSDEQEGTRHAQWLSQVSQRFRRITFEDTTLWSTLYQSYDFAYSKDIEGCIGRTRDDADLHLVLSHNENSGLSASCEFVKTCSPYAPRWKSLTLIGNWNIVGRQIGQDTIGDMLDGLMGDVELHLPRLDELCLIEHRYDGTGRRLWFAEDQVFGNEEWWTTPNIRVLRCTQYIPHRYFPFGPLTSFTLSLTLIAENVTEQMRLLCAFLAGMFSLEEMDLQLSGLAEDEEEVLVLDGQISLPSLTTLRFSVWQYINSLGVRCVLEPFLKTLEMPNLESFSLSTDLLELPVNLIPDPTSHPRITKVFFEAPRIGYTGSRFGRQYGSEDDPTALDIPLNRIPNVSSLSLTTKLREVVFSRGDRSERSNFGGSSLRNLCLKSCRNMNYAGLRDAVWSLKSADSWDGLEQVAIQRCNLLDYAAAVKAIGEDRLYFTRA